MFKRPILCAITASNAQLSHADIANAAVRANVPMVQLRMKGASSTEMYETARTLRAITKGKALLIVNDSLEVALTVGADGVHLGKEDLPIDAARRISPKGFLIGASVSNAYEAKKPQRSELTTLERAPCLLRRISWINLQSGLLGCPRYAVSSRSPFLRLGA